MRGSVAGRIAAREKGKRILSSCVDYSGHQHLRNFTVHEREIKPDSRSGLNPRFDMTARNLALQPVNKLSTLAVHEIDELVLLAT